jgi:ABC-2 type transport system ATP-binding protein
MAAIECKNVGIRYKTGDLKAIGLKEFIIKKETNKEIKQSLFIANN